MTDDDYRSRLEAAYDPDETPPLVPTDAARQMIITDERPRGAIVVDVPRKEALVFSRIKAVANAAGDDFFYRWPVKKFDKKTGREEVDWVEGPSVKLTNAVARMYGNCGIKTRVIDEGKHWMIYVQFTDFETGYTMERPFQQRKAQNVGKKMDADRATDLVFQIGVSKATRNVVANALSDFVNYAFLEAKDGIAKRINDKPEVYRARLRDRLAELKVDVSRVEAHVGRTIEKWLVPDMAKIVAEIQTINDGMADIDDLWPGETLTPPVEREIDEGDETDVQPQDAKESAQIAEPAKEEEIVQQKAEVKEAVAQKVDESPRQVAKTRPPAEESKPQARDVGPKIDPNDVAAQILERISAAIEEDSYPTAEALTDLKEEVKPQIAAVEGLKPEEVEMFQGQLAALILSARKALERKAKRGK